MSTDTRTEWAVRYTSPYGSHVTPSQDEGQARRWAAARPQEGCSIELLRREVTVTEWEKGGLIIMSELVSRLLAAIKQREAEALSISACRLVEGMAGRRVDPELSRYVDTVADPDLVLRLCRAHRKILDYCVAELGTNPLCSLGHDIVHTLAGGYGITEETSDE